MRRPVARWGVAAVLAVSALALGGCHSSAAAPGPAAPSGSPALDGVERQLGTIEQGLDADGRG